MESGKYWLGTQAQEQIWIIRDGLHCEKQIMIIGRTKKSIYDIGEMDIIWPDKREWLMDENQKNRGKRKNNMFNKGYSKWRWITKKVEWKKWKYSQMWCISRQTKYATIHHTTYSNWNLAATKQATKVKARKNPTIPKNQASPPTCSPGTSTFIPKSPVTRCSGTKIVASTVTRLITEVIL